MARRPFFAAASALALVVGGVAAGPAAIDAQEDESAAFQALDAPARLLDTRPDTFTIDGEQMGGGQTSPDATLELPVGGRAGVPDDAGAVAVNITAIVAADDGFVTAYPCNEERPNASNLNHSPGQTIAAAALVRLDSEGRICLFTSGTTDLAVDVTGVFPDGGYDALGSPQRLLDTREASATIDGQFESIGVRDAESTLELDVAGRGDLAGSVSAVVLSVTVAGPSAAGYVTVHPCDGDRPIASNLNFAGGQTIANLVVSRVDASGRVCIFTSADTHVIVDAAGELPMSIYEALDQPQRLLDTRSPGATADDEFVAGGKRPRSSTLQLDVAGRAGVPDDAGAVVLNVTTIEAGADGFTTIHPAGIDRPEVSNLNVSTGDTVANAVVTQLGADGAVCLFSDTTAHYVVDVVGWLPGTPAATADGECPSPPLFPTYRMVALYGNDASDQLGALGEQPPEQAAERLAAVMEPWQAASDRPVLGTFELIATIASVSPGDDGMYRIVSSEEHVQRYLDVARDNGYYLLLDIQPGRSDFLTEVQRYERFLREPDVGIALDPEWKVGPDQVPGQTVGQVSAAEVNQVAEYVAGIVAEEGLPQKLFVVHQFQDRMITDRDQLIAPPELAVNIHMDGFGTRQMKLETYSVTQVEPPFSNGFKLFYDEDIDMFAPADVLALDPVPDLITYQ